MARLQGKYVHTSSPKKARLRGAAALARQIPASMRASMGVTQRQIFQQECVTRSAGQRALASSSDRRTPKEESRGRHSIIDDRDLRELERVLWKEGSEGRAMKWAQLGFMAGIAASARTIQRTMRQLDYRRCVACQRDWISPSLARRRLTFAKVMLIRYPLPSDWYNVRFSDETHCGYGSPGRMYMTRRPCEVNCPDCVQTVHQPKKKDEKRVHYWGCVGYGYKSELYPYDTNNNNGKMTQKVYIELLTKECKDWPEEWVLEEDGDSGHGTSKSNPVKKWKAQHQLKSYFNCAHSPDLAPIERAWQAPKEELLKYTHWDEATIHRYAQQGWDGLKINTINKWVDQIPDILRAIIRREGQMSGY